MAAKKKASTFGAKAEFVRATARSMSAKEVVEAAKKKGITLTENYVYTVRSSGSKKKVGKPGPKPGSKGKSSATGMTSAEAQLRDAIADLGLVKATEILQSVKATIKGR